MKRKKKDDEPTKRETIFRLEDYFSNLDVSYPGPLPEPDPDPIRQLQPSVTHYYCTSGEVTQKTATLVLDLERRLEGLDAARRAILAELPIEAACQRGERLVVHGRAIDAALAGARRLLADAEAFKQKDAWAECEWVEGELVVKAKNPRPR